MWLARVGEFFPASFFSTSYGGKKHVYIEITPIAKYDEGERYTYRDEKLERESGRKKSEEYREREKGRKIGKESKAKRKG